MFWIFLSVFGTIIISAGLFKRGNIILGIISIIILFGGIHFLFLYLGRDIEIERLREVNEDLKCQ